VSETVTTETSPPDPVTTGTSPPTPGEPGRSAAPHARRRPGLVAILYAYHALVGLLLALPAAITLGAPTARWPRRQAEIFDPGGLMLLESLRLSRRALPAVETAAGAVAAVALLAGVLPLAALLVGLDREGRLEAGRLAGRAAAHTGTLALVTGLGALFQALVAGVVVLVGEEVLNAIHPAAPARDIGDVVVVALGAAAALLAGVLRDLAATAAVRGDHGLYLAGARALHAARHAGGRALAAWAWRAALGLGAVLLGAWLAPPPAGATGAAVALGVVLHQAAIAGATFAHASWLAAAMRIHDATAARWAGPP
jgi:hypothetical protein